MDQPAVTGTAAAQDFVSAVEGQLADGSEGEAAESEAATASRAGGPIIAAQGEQHAVAGGQGAGSSGAAETFQRELGLQFMKAAHKWLRKQAKASAEVCCCGGRLPPLRYFLDMGLESFLLPQGRSGRHLPPVRGAAGAGRGWWLPTLMHGLYRYQHGALENSFPSAAFNAALAYALIACNAGWAGACGCCISGSAASAGSRPAAGTCGSLHHQQRQAGRQHPRDWWVPGPFGAGQAGSLLGACWQLPTRKFARGGWAPFLFPSKVSAISARTATSKASGCCLHMPFYVIQGPWQCRAKSVRLSRCVLHSLRRAHWNCCACLVLVHY